MIASQTALGRVGFPMILVVWSHFYVQRLHAGLMDRDWKFPVEFSYERRRWLPASGLVEKETKVFRPPVEFTAPARLNLICSFIRAPPLAKKTASLIGKETKIVC